MVYVLLLEKGKSQWLNTSLLWCLTLLLRVSDSSKVLDAGVYQLVSANRQSILNPQAPGALPPGAASFLAPVVFIVFRFSAEDIICNIACCFATMLIPLSAGCLPDAW